MKRPRRNLAVFLSVLVHSGLLALLLRAPAAAPPAAQEAMVVSMFDGRVTAKPTARPPSAAAKRPQSVAPTEPAPPSPPRPPPDIAPRYAAVEPPADTARLDQDPTQDPVALSVTADAAVSGQACALGSWLRTALQADPQVRAALATIPRSNRSVANAIMLWDERWVPQPANAVAGVSVLRAALTIGVRAAPSACQAQLVRGPELVPLMEPSGSVVLAIGSGEWRWADLLDDSKSEAIALAGPPP